MPIPPRRRLPLPAQALRRQAMTKVDRPLGMHPLSDREIREQVLGHSESPIPKTAPVRSGVFNDQSDSFSYACLTFFIKLDLSSIVVPYPRLETFLGALMDEFNRGCSGSSPKAILLKHQGEFLHVVTGNWGIQILSPSENCFELRTPDLKTSRLTIDTLAKELARFWRLFQNEARVETEGPSVLQLVFNSNRETGVGTDVHEKKMRGLISALIHFDWYFGKQSPGGSSGNRGKVLDTRARRRVFQEALETLSRTVYSRQWTDFYDSLEDADFDKHWNLYFDESLVPPDGHQPVRAGSDSLLKEYVLPRYCNTIRIRDGSMTAASSRAEVLQWMQFCNGFVNAAMATSTVHLRRLPEGMEGFRQFVSGRKCPAGGLIYPVPRGRLVQGPKNTGLRRIGKKRASPDQEQKE